MSGAHWNRAGRRSGGQPPVRMEIPAGGRDHDFVMFAIYENPSDYPGKFVVRRFTCKKGVPDPIPDAEPYAVEVCLRSARASLPVRYYNLMRFPRHPQDEPQIVETWL